MAEMLKPGEHQFTVSIVHPNTQDGCPMIGDKGNLIVTAVDETGATLAATDAILFGSCQNSIHGNGPVFYEIVSVTLAPTLKTAPLTGRHPA